MTIAVKCPKCGKGYAVQDSMAGKQAKCNCGGVINIPSANAAEPSSSLSSFFDDELSHEAAKVAQREQFAQEQAARPAHSNPYAPPTGAAPRGSGEFAACPNCRQQNAKRLHWTWWGGLIGPAVFCHVKCPNCRTTYNGRTGRSNQTVIILWLVIPFILGIGGCLFFGLLGLLVDK